MNKFIPIVLVGGLAITGMSMAQADEEQGGPMHHRDMACLHGDGDHVRGDRLQRMKEHLNLNEAQVKQIGDIFAKSSTDSKAFRKTMRENRQQLHALMQADKPDEAKIRALAEAQGRTRGDLLILHSKQRAAINQVLTPEQRSKMQAHFRSHRHHEEGGDK